MIQNEIIVRRPRPHLGQKTILTERKRFNVICNGRRWGKTVLAVFLILESILKGHPVGFFAPTPEFYEEVWDEIVDRCESIISYKNISKSSIRFSTGGSIKFWSLEKKRAGRGRKYKRVLIDEAAFAQNLQDSWTKVLRATLLDMEGDAYFFSTPNGSDDYFYLLFNMFKKHQNWMSWRMPSHTNPKLNKDELAEIETQLPKLVFEQEYLAEFVSFNGLLFFQNFIHKTHVRLVKYDVQYNLYVAFDFNITNTALIIQKQYIEGKDGAEGKDGIQVLAEYHNELLDLSTLCIQIQADYPNALFVINGDASGNSGSSLTKGNQSAYDIIKAEFGIPWERFDIPSVNPSHKDSYILCNSVFKNTPISIHPSCEGLLKDLEHVKVKQEKGKFEIVKADDKLTHHADPLRYFIEANFRGTLSFLQREDAA
jgi:hypothetical protein